jgi:hypothetical protein
MRITFLIRKTGKPEGIMKTITSTIIAIAVTLAIGLTIGGNTSYSASDIQTQAFAPLTVNDLLRI